MKANQFKYRILPFIFLFFTSAQWLVGQNVFPSFTNAPEWNVAHIGHTKAQTETIEFKSDTLLCGKVYSVVELWEDFTIYVFSDTLKTTYKYETDCNAPSYILYDYSLNQGATYPVESFAQFEVIETDSVTLFEVTRKRLKVNSALGQMYWIEGIGSTVHPFHSVISSFLNGSIDYSLLCYHEDGEQFYQTPAHDSCSLEYQIPRNYFYFNIAPNPFQSHTNIRIETVEFHEVTVELYSSIGQLLEIHQSPRGAFHNFEIGEKIDSKGIYIVKIQIDDAIHTEKILKWE